MPWFVEHASEIVRPRVEELTLRACEEARERICRDPQRVLLLPPDITRMHSGSGWVTEIMYDHFTAGGADCRVIPTLGQHIPHTEKENRAMFGAIPNDRIHAHDWRGLCASGKTFRGVRCGNHTRCRQLGGSDRSQHNDHARTVGHCDQHRPCRATRSAWICEPQQKLFYWLGGQGNYLHNPHGRSLLRYRKQPRMPYYASSGGSLIVPKKNSSVESLIFIFSSHLRVLR